MVVEKACTYLNKWKFCLDHGKNQALAWRVSSFDINNWRTYRSKNFEELPVLTYRIQVRVTATKSSIIWSVHGEIFENCSRLDTGEIFQNLHIKEIWAEMGIDPRYSKCSTRKLIATAIQQRSFHVHPSIVIRYRNFKTLIVRFTAIQDSKTNCTGIWRITLGEAYLNKRWAS